ncbi:MAG: phosphodiester glycosidase family protein [Telluria sp.]
MKSTTLLLGAALAVLAGGAGAAAAPDPLGLAAGKTELPLGAHGLPQQVTVAALAPGVTYYQVRRGAAGEGAGWYLLGDVARDDAALGRLKDCFARLKLQPKVDAYHIAGADRTVYRTVSGGAFASRATAEQGAAAAPGCHLHARRVAEDTGNQRGPWNLRIVAVDPAVARGRWLAAARREGPLLRAPTSELARAAHALFGVNGGFFVEQPVDGVPGEPAGVSMLSGQVNGAPVAHRPTVVLDAQPGKPVAIVRQMRWETALDWSDGARTVVDGINRKPGFLRNCGGTPADPAIHDWTCKSTDDLVYYPAGSPFGKDVAAGVRYAIDGAGRARKLAPGEAPAAADALLAVSAGSSRAAQLDHEIAAHATARFRFDSSLLRDAGREVSLVNAGPMLLEHGAPVREDAQEGWAIDGVDDAAHALLMHDWINRRNPRTAIGVRKDGVILVAVVDGHAPEASVGLTIEELRSLMAALGAADAVNLDGGGSSAMVVKGQLDNHPSDADGERKIGDAILFIPQD